MICPKCGNECGKSNYCSKCGTKLIRTCVNCKKPLNEGERFCPFCGTDNAEVKEDYTVGVIGFIFVLVVSILKLFRLLTVRGAFHIWTNGFFFDLPFTGFAVSQICLYVLLVIFASICRAKGTKWCGIVSIVLASLTCAFSVFQFGGWILLLGTIMSFADRRKK